MDSPENSKPPADQPPVTAEKPATPAHHPDEPQDLRSWVARNSFGLMLIVGVILFILQRWGAAGLLSATIVGLGLSFIIFIHELGHFAVAKWCDVHVETFSIGFGPPLPGCRWQKGETTYMIAMVPLGGYVKMVGENPENDEDDTDPRSFKNKPVWQRMAIISAGVTMNLIFGCIAFIIVYMFRGDQTPPGIVGQVEAGGAAWQKGTKAGDIIYQIGNKKDKPTFDQLRYQVILSRKDEKLPYVFGWPDQKKIETTLEPIRSEQEGRPMAGMVSAPSLKLFPEEVRSKVKVKTLAKPGSAAARAEPPFDFGDEIIGSSFDPEDPEIKPVPGDPRPRRDQQKVLDYFVFQRRLADLAGKPMKVQVRRAKAGAEAEIVDIEVPPAFYHSLGVRMQMGTVVAIQENSPAAKAGIRPRNAATQTEGDRIEEVEVDDPKGGKIRWVLKSAPAAGVQERPLDPIRLPFELSQWARSMPSGQPKIVRLTVLREGKHARKETLPLEWNDQARYDQPMATSLTSPEAVAELGLAYQIDTTVHSVEDQAPAARAKKQDGSTTSLQPGDVVVAYWFFTKENDEAEPTAAKVNELKRTTKLLVWTLKEEPIREAWPYIFYGLQDQEVKKVGLRIERDGSQFDVVLEPTEDQTWPRVDRGIAYWRDIQVEKSDNAFEAMGLGFARTYTTVIMIYLQFESLLTNRISFPQHAAGPVGIFRMALDFVEDPFAFLLFLAMISVNLAVINFLPIPVLDGGHMVFLIYEWIRGKPAAEWVRLATTYAGLALIVFLMLYVIYLDVARLLSG